MRDKRLRLNIKLNTNIGLTHCTAWVLWAIALCGVALAWFVDGEHLGQAAIVAAAAAATLHTRSFLCQMQELLKRAFDLGREYEAIQSAAGTQATGMPVTRLPRQAARDLNGVGVPE